MGTSLRSQVLAHYKKLLYTAQVVFQNDPIRIASKFIFVLARNLFYIFV